MDFDVTKHTIFRTLTGSRVYGTYNEDSDYDTRGVAIPPRRYFYGFSSKFEQSEDKINDTVIFNFNKFLKLAAENNPNIIELLYVPARFWEVSSPYWQTLVENRGLFLSKKCFYTFTGYAHSQLRRLRSHRHWLMKGDLQKPLRENYGLVDGRELPPQVRNASSALIERYLGRWPIEEELSSMDKETATALRHCMWDYLETTLSLTKMEIEGHTWVASGKALGYEDNFLELLKLEKRYQADMREYKSWLNWKKTRNEKRKALEQKCGYDSKHASHLVRLLLMCREILEQHTLIVERPDAELLKGIRDGAWPYEQLEEWSERQFEELKVLYGKSDLQHGPNRTKIEKIGLEILERYFQNGEENEV